ncbi:hypothetical protein JCM10212_006464 [Sporobolomyces blumeae]
MKFARSCSACVRSARVAYPAPRVALAAARGVHAFAPSPALSKKQQTRSADAFEEEFEEDEIDDVDAELERQPGAGGEVGVAQSRTAAHEATVARLDEVLGQPAYLLDSRPPSNKLLTNLFATTDSTTLAGSLELLKAWRKKGLGIPNDKAVKLLLARLAAWDGPDARRAMGVIADRTSYGVEVRRIEDLYPLFKEWSKSRAKLEREAERQQPEDRVDVADVVAIQSDLCHDLLTLAEQHAPESVAVDAFGHLATLATTLEAHAVRPSPVSHARVARLIEHLERLGEDYIVQEVKAKFGRKWRYVARYRGMRVVDGMRKGNHAELEWFAHLAESLVVASRSPWARGKTQESSEQDLEAQNDQHLDQLHSKIAALRGVTTDIYNDSRGQNTLLDSTGSSFDSFKTSLSNTSTRFARSVQSGKGGARIQLGIVAAFVLLFVLYKLSSRSGGASAGP